MITRDDKRDFLRMRVEAPIDITLLDQSDSHTVTGVCHDLSATGLSFDAPIEVTEGSEVLVVVGKGGPLPPLEARVKIVRSEQLESGQWSLGGQIIEMR
ncbi:MAG: PilZ domain-containing protein [Idiomarina sp.]|nr:PilZ domain-containing protein [Idiomarina sp.]